MFFSTPNKPHWLRSDVKLVSIILLAMLLNGCSNLLPSRSLNDTQNLRPYTSPTANPELSDETLQDLLTAELAAQRRQFDVALQHYLHQAHLTKDPAIAERAVHLAMHVEQQAYLAEAIDVWIEADPNNAESHLVATQAYLNTGNIQLAIEHFKEFNKLSQSTQYDFLANNSTHLPKHKKKELLNELNALQETQSKDASLWLATGLLHSDLGNYNQALADTNRSLKIAPKSLSARLHKARLLALQEDYQPSLKILNKLQKQYPRHKGVQVLKARVLLGQGKHSDALAMFEKVDNDFPTDPSIVLSLGLMHLEVDQLDRAQEYFYQLLITNNLVNEAHFHLGRIAEKDQYYQEAIEHYNQVTFSQELVPAKARATQLINKEYDLSTALSFIKQQKEIFPTEKNPFIRIEADLLADAKKYAAAIDLLTSALTEHPQNIEFLYSRALIAERAGNLELLEKDLRYILVIDPQNVHALNALGYTFADHNYNLEEAFQLIQQAYNLSSGNAAIADSLGWVHFRLGNLEVASELLEQAYNSVPDHEISAHFGEVLWLQNKPEKALDVWKKGYQDKPDSDVLNSTLQRLEVAPELWPTQDPQP